MDDSCRSDENEVYDNNYDNISSIGNRAVSREENMTRARQDSVAPKKKKRVSKKTELENKLSSRKKGLMTSLINFLKFFRQV